MFDPNLIRDLQDMTAEQHVQAAYELLSTRATYEREGINASKAVAHLLLADRKDRNNR